MLGIQYTLNQNEPGRPFTPMRKIELRKVSSHPSFDTKSLMHCTIVSSSLMHCLFYLGKRQPGSRMRRTTARKCKKEPTDWQSLTDWLSTRKGLFVTDHKIPFRKYMTWPCQQHQRRGWVKHLGINLAKTPTPTIRQLLVIPFRKYMTSHDPRTVRDGRSMWVRDNDRVERIG